MTTRPDYRTLEPMPGSPADSHAGKPVDSGKPVGAVNGGVHRDHDQGVHTTVHDSK